MILYAETSAILRWLLGAARGDEVRTLLERARLVFTSRLTLIETHRALARAVATGNLAEAAAQEIAARFAAASARWIVVEVLAEIGDRAVARFPVEPVRALDAVHLATALYLVPHAGSVVVLSTDDRIVRNAPLLGLGLAPPA